MTRIARFGTLVLVAAALTEARASAQHAGPPGSGPRGDCLNQLAAYVGLSDAQKTALETLQRETAAAIAPIVDQTRALRQQVETALAAASPDRCAIGDLVIAEYGLRQQIETLRRNAEASFVASLSADQQAKYSAFIAANPACAAFPTRIPILGAPPA